MWAIICWWRRYEIKEIFMKTFGKWCVCLMLMLVFTIPAIAQTRSITDTTGRQVEVPADPRRIVCIGPGALRLVVYLEAQDRVVGVEEMEKANPGGRPYWLAHPELAKLPRIGPGGPAGINKKPDMEAVLMARPDVIFITYMDKALADDVQKLMHIPVVVLSYGEFATFDAVFYDSLRIAGRILNREKRAEALSFYIAALQTDLSDRVKNIPEAQKPSAYIGGIGMRGNHGIESSEKNFIPLEWAGARNVAKPFAASEGSHVIMDRETLLSVNPDVIFIDGGGLTLVSEDYGKKPEFYHALKAFQTRRVMVLHPFNFYTTNIDTALTDAWAVGKILYPDRFKDIDLEKKADVIYTFFVGRPVYEQMKQTFGAVGQTAPFITAKIED
jgi:iron complex transport system substrate-binding protein